MNYLAGIHLSHNQGIEAIVAGSTIITIASLARNQRKWFSKSENEGGKITTGPTTLIGRLVTPIHVCAIMAVPVSYLAAVFLNQMEQPEWYAQTSLENVLDMNVGIGPLAWIRTAAAVGTLGTIWCHGIVLRELGKQFHYIGVREKANVVSTGPYAVVRHPMYTTFLGQLALLSVAYWSWIPLVSLGICAGAFAYKMPIEEELIEQDPAIGPAYRDYKKKVTCKIIPYIW
ncbi:hypothetical protein BT96DRAFT_915812 [Gymnopus androsaceus JB14]|uniref:Protein-S-isoprenylcysteine O-methyltransferase n=1 Tax=Gymnopus androsaceus JB14 TaxID=1447944 RepID=A0A6A4I965_9AGAR|nr:hypothetical protein BT96DRAFT_915812 [Gymnopus androsaceus JB14]